MTPAKPFTVAEIELANALLNAQSGAKVVVPRGDFERLLVTARKGAEVFAAEYEAQYRSMIGMGRVT